MATIFSGVDTGSVRYDASYTTSRPDVNSAQVVVYVTIRAYTSSSAGEYFGYNLYLNYININGSWVAGNSEIKANSPSQFDITKTYGPFYVNTTGTSIPNCYISLTSTNNSGNSGKYNYGNFSMSCPAYVEPNIASVSMSLSNITMTSVKISWSTDRAAKAIQYKKFENGAWGGWTGAQSSINTTSSNFTVSGLTHSKYYAFQIRAQSYTSGNWTEQSGFKDMFTVEDGSLSGISSSFYSDTGNPSVNYSNPAGASCTIALVYGSSNTVLWSTTVSATSGSVTASLDETDRSTLYNQCKSSTSLSNSIRFRITTANSVGGSSSSTDYSGYTTMNVRNSNPVWNKNWVMLELNSTVESLTGWTETNPRFINKYSHLRFKIPANAAESKNPTGNMDRYSLSVTGYTLADLSHSTSADVYSGICYYINTTNIQITAYDKRRK